MGRSIVFVLQTLDVGGTERQFSYLARGLQSVGWDVGIFSVRGHGDLSRSLVESGIALLHDVPRRTSDYRGTGSTALRLYRSLRRVKPDIVHCALPLPSFLGSLAARAAGIPVVITSKRGLATHHDKHWFARYLDFASNAASTQITANSRAVRDDAIRWEGAPAQKIRVIANGVKLETQAANAVGGFRHEHGLASDDVLIVCTAGFRQAKGHAILVAAFRKLVDDGLPVRLVLIGPDRGNLDEVEAQTKTLRIDDRVLFLGQRDDVPALLPQMDIGVLCSFEEGSSNAVIEKLAAGLPMVATDVGGNAEAMEGIEGTYLVPPGDVDALHRALRSAVADRASNPFDRAARIAAVVDRFAMSRMIERHIELYEELLGRHGRPRP
jgi:glycosyltransferase involved in cell wall biosynthesis